MKEHNVFEMFENMHSKDSNAYQYEVVSIPNSCHKIGKTQEGWPKFFVKTTPGKNALYNIKGEFLWVEYNVDCSIVDDSQHRIESNFTIITLKSDNESLQKLFIEIFALTLLTLPAEPSEPELSVKIEGLLSIFSSLKKPSLHKIQGLWAELLVIERSNNPECVALAWHNSPRAKYDFTKGDDKIEVKSTSSEERIHRFGLEQLNPSKNSNLLIASVKVRESSEDEHGLSVMDLYDRIRNKVKNVSVRIHIYSVIINTLGNQYEKALNYYFDYSQASDSLSFFDYRDVPKIEGEINHLVTEVSFSSNLSGLKDVFESGNHFSEESLYKALV